VGKFGHGFTFRGKSQELFRWGHRPTSRVSRVCDIYHIERDRKFLAGPVCDRKILSQTRLEFAAPHKIDPVSAE
jgi:hypothetical protein